LIANCYPAELSKRVGGYKRTLADYRAIRTDRHKLIHWIQHPEFDELYDLTTDPREERNVIKEPANHGLVERLRSGLGKLVQHSISL
jgi:hypothetical protein